MVTNATLTKRAAVLTYPKDAAALIAAEGEVDAGILDMTAADLGTRSNVLRLPQAAADFIRDVVLAEESSSSSSE